MNFQNVDAPRNACLDAVLQAQTLFMVDQNPEGAFEALLAQFLELTGGECGGIGRVFADDEGTLGFDWLANLHIRADAQTEVNKAHLRERLNRVLETGCRVIIDTAPISEGDAVYPSCFVGLPVYAQGRMVGLVGLSNCLPGAAAQKELEALVTACSSLIAASRHAGKQMSESAYQMLFESSRDALITLSPVTYRFINANRAALKLFGVSSIGAFKRLSPMALAPEFQPDGEPTGEHVKNMIAETMSKGFHSCECVRRRMDGGDFFAEVLITRMDMDGELFLMASVRDITERKSLEQALKESEQKLKEAQHITRVGSWELDLTTGKLFCSDEVFRLLEIQEALPPFAFQDFMDVIHPEDRDAMSWSSVGRVCRQRWITRLI